MAAGILCGQIVRRRPGIKEIDSTDALFFQNSKFVVDLVVEPGPGDVF